MPKYIFKYPNVFISIPKAASSTTSAVLQHHLGWDETNSLMADDGWNFYALIRHPIDRWVSGMAQRFAGAISEKDITKKMRVHLDAIHDDERLWDYVEKGEHDVHTQRQSAIISGAPDPALFKLESMDAMWEAMGVDLPEMDSDHIHKTNGYQKDVMNHLSEALERVPAYREYLLKFYEDDLKLYEQAN